MKIRHRLLLASAINILIVAVVGYLSFQTSQSMQDAYQKLNRQGLPLIEALEQIRSGALRVVASTSEAGLLHTLGGDIESDHGEAALAEEGTHLLTEAVTNYRTLIDSYFAHEVATANEVSSSAEKLLKESAEFFEALDRRADADDLIEIKEELEVAEIQLLELSVKALTQKHTEIAAQSKAVTAALTSHRNTVTIGLALIILISALTAWTNAAYIAGPLRRLRNASMRIAAGEAGVEVSERSEGEIGELSHAFNAMAARLDEQRTELQSSHAYTLNILEVMQDILIAADASGTIRKINRAAREQLGYGEKELIGKPIDQLFDCESRTSSLSEFLPLDKEGHFERRMLNRDSHAVPVLASVSRMGDGNGFLLVATNITARKLAEEKIHKLAYYDPLSGLPNRTLFYDRLHQAVKLAARQKHQLAVMFMDVDNFKQVNDTLGHDVGDALLRELSERLTAALRESDVVSHGDDLLGASVSRHGGDEFLILLPKVSQALDAALVSQRIRDQLSTGFNLATHELFTSMSIGIAIYPQDGADERQLVQNADTALYSAKAAGKNQFAFFKSEMNSSALRRLDIEVHLRKAEIKSEFQLHFQPQLDLATGQLIGMEALLRWRHAEWGLVSPVEFIPVAESTGLILPIGEWVLYEACRQLGRWQAQGMKPGKMSINLSANQFKDPELHAKIADAIAESGIAPDSLVLEITESVLMQDAQEALVQLRNLKALGVKFAVDDFGTGYSSLSYLKTFPLDYLKIDRAFIRDLESSESDQELVRTIISMARNLRMKLVAEGVETPGQLRFLESQQCEYMQGFMLSRPLEPEAYADAFLKAELNLASGLLVCRSVLGVKDAGAA